jgi:hypothetical protein
MIKRSNAPLLEQIRHEREKVQQLGTLFDRQEAELAALRARVSQL